MSTLWPGEPTWPDRASLEAATSTYEQTWWRENPAVVAECEMHPHLRDRLSDSAAAGIVTTADVYRDTGTGGWSKSRQRIHEHVAKQCLLGTPAQRERPCAHVTIGCAGSGKTTALRRLVHAHRRLEFGDEGSVVIIDADQVRQRLPEYAKGQGHQVVADECFSLTYDQVLPQALSARHDLVFDTLGKPEARIIIERMVDGGYDVHVLLAEAPTQVCFERATLRALIDGRTVPKALVEDVRPVARQTFESLIAHAPTLAGWALVDTSGEPTLLQSGGRWSEVGSDVLTAATKRDSSTA